jgi:hypothetical protein
MEIIYGSGLTAVWFNHNNISLQTLNVYGYIISVRQSRKNAPRFSSSVVTWLVLLDQIPLTTLLKNLKSKGYIVNENYLL